ncbi:Imm8 family immunity protein [Aeromicrobium duanguangcaii]|uniref:Imm8 family immunity protein n=1 Tax=Aeromicrobium duanguangcaii TaxID=2968086 RepID=UPI00384F0A2B
MRAAVRTLMSLEVDDLAGWVPEDDSWALGVRIIAGPDDGPGEESFDLVVCNLGWLVEQLQISEVIDGRHLLIVDSYVWPSLRAHIERRVQECEGSSWEEVAGQLGRFAFWEFEDYQH